MTRCRSRPRSSRALQTFVTRRIDTFDPVVITITYVRAGTTTNVIPENVHLRGTLRAVSPGGRRRALEGVEQVVDRHRRARTSRRASRHDRARLPADDQRRRRSRRSRSTSLPTCSAPAEHRAHAGAGHGRRGLLVRARAAARRARVPRRVPARHPPRRRARVPLEPHDNSTRTRCAPASRCTAPSPNASSPRQLA